MHVKEKGCSLGVAANGNLKGKHGYPVYFHQRDSVQKEEGRASKGEVHSVHNKKKEGLKKINIDKLKRKLIKR